MVHNYKNIIMNTTYNSNDDHIKIQSLPPYKIYNYVTSPRKISFQQWLDEPVCDYEKPWTRYGDFFTHKHFIIDYCHDLLDIISKNNYSIKNEKQFKNEIATFIYRLSKERH